LGRNLVFRGFKVKYLETCNRDFGAMFFLAPQKPLSPLTHFIIMGRAQYAKGRVQLKVGRNNACRRNAVILDPSVRVATLPYTKAATPRPPGKSDKSAPLTPRTSARLQAKIPSWTAFVEVMKRRFPSKNSRESMLSLDEKVFGGEEPHFAFECRPDIDEVPDHVAFMGEQAETRTQRPKTMALVCVSRNKKIGLWWLPMGKGRGKGVSSATLKPIWKQIRARAKALKIKKPVLVYDRATVHTSKESQAELDRVFGKGNHEIQAPKSPDTNNGDAGLFPNGARATACSGATNKAEVEKAVTEWWKTVVEKMLTAINDRVLRNYDRILELKGGNFYDESRVPNS